MTHTKEHALDSRLPCTSAAAASGRSHV